MFLPTNVSIGQKWSVWYPSRQQWLLAVVTSRGGGRATLKFHAGYEIEKASNEYAADEDTMLTAPNRFRFVE